MPVEFVLIPKNGSTFLRSIQPFLSSEKDISIIVLRHPIQRFWAAAKEVHPLPTYRERIDDCVKILRQETKFSTFAVDIFFSDLDLRKNAYNHLKPQSILIGKRKPDYVFRLENLTSGLNGLIAAGVIASTRNLEDFVAVKQSDHSNDDVAMKYILEHYNDFLTSYYNEDFILYNDTTKVMYGSSN